MTLRSQLKLYVEFPTHTKMSPNCVARRLSWCCSSRHTFTLSRDLCDNTWSLHVRPCSYKFCRRQDSVCLIAVFSLTWK